MTKFCKLNLMMITAFLMSVTLGVSAQENATPAVETQTWTVDEYRVELKSTSGKNAMMVADELVLQLKIVGPEGGGVKIKALEEQWGDFEVLEQGVQDNLPAGHGERFWLREYKLTRYESGEAQTGEIEFDYKIFPSGLWKTFRVEPLKVEVHSVLMAEEQDPMQIRPEQGTAEMPPPYSRGFSWLYLMIGVFVIGAIVAILVPLLIWRSMKRKMISLEDQVLQSMRDLQSEKLLESGQQEIFYTRLTDIVRGYIEAAFGLRAPNQTTPEFLVNLTRADSSLSKHAPVLTAFMQQADMVKFAAQVGDADQAIAAAKQFVHQSAAELRAQEAAAKQAKNNKKAPVAQPELQMPVKGAGS